METSGTVDGVVSSAMWVGTFQGHDLTLPGTLSIALLFPSTLFFGDNLVTTRNKGASHITTAGWASFEGEGNGGDPVGYA